MRLKQLLLGVFCVWMTASVSAQSNEGMAFTNWASAELNYDINKDWKAGVEVQSRTSLQTGQLNNLFFAPSVEWKIMKHLETAVSYRLTSVPYSSATTNRINKHRFTLDLTFRKLEDLVFSGKNRLGVSVRLRGTTEHQLEELTENTLRGKLKLEYNLPKTKLDLFASTELFYRFQRDLIYTFDEVQSVNAINKYRVKMGAEYPFGDHHSVKLFGMHQWRYPDGGSELVIGVGYAFQLN